MSRYDAYLERANPGVACWQIKDNEEPTDCNIVATVWTRTADAFLVRDAFNDRAKRLRESAAGGLHNPPELPAEGPAAPDQPD